MKGEKEKMKMGRPELEVIRFKSEDIITTSGTGGLQITGNGKYATFAREVKQAGDFKTYTDSAPVSWYSDKTQFFVELINGKVDKCYPIKDDSLHSWADTGTWNSLYYAWYNNSPSYKFWGTDNQWVSTYSDLPFGTD